MTTSLSPHHPVPYFNQRNCPPLHNIRKTTKLNTTYRSLTLPPELDNTVPLWGRTMETEDEQPLLRPLLGRTKHTISAQRNRDEKRLMQITIRPVWMYDLMRSWSKMPVETVATKHLQAGEENYPFQGGVPFFLREEEENRLRIPPPVPLMGSKSLHHPPLHQSPSEPLAAVVERAQQAVDRRRNLEAVITSQNAYAQRVMEMTRACLQQATAFLLRKCPPTYDRPQWYPPPKGVQQLPRPRATQIVKQEMDQRLGREGQKGGSSL